jgi:NAD(P)H-hydrate epimerase
MVEVDRLAVEEFHIELLQMMENAGRNLARLTVEHFPDAQPIRSGVVILAGPGHQLASLRRIGVHLLQADEVGSLPPPDLILDGLTGYGISGEPHGAVARLIRWANSGSAPILALDLPSGLDATLGPVHQVCIRADATLTLAVPKQGLLIEGASDLVGVLYLADIGVPPQVYAAMGIDGMWERRFADGEILRVIP